jgi:hypothetical protein
MLLLIRESKAHQGCKNHRMRPVDKEKHMQSALQLKTTVLPGGRIEIAAQELSPGESVDVIILFPSSQGSQRRSALDILAEAPGQCQFKTAAEVDEYLRRERDAWDC